MMMVLVFALTLIVLTSVAGVLRWRSRKRDNREARRCAQLLDQLLTMMQLLQKHRGLGAQKTSAGAFQREQIAVDIDRQWSFLLPQCEQMPALQAHWKILKANPADFAEHCKIIDHLLGSISIMERRITALQRDGTTTISERCRGLEDLARLRGLSSRATNYAQCPIELEVPLRYLCQRLARTSFQCNEAAVRAAVNEICTNLIDARHVSITASRCFELLTPIIDAALEEVRHAVTQHRESGASAKLAPANTRRQRMQARPIESLA